MTDLISRAAALEALGECPYNWNDWPEEIQAVDDWESHKEAIENIPAVDAVPVVHGRWVKMTGMMPPEYVGHYECSVCQWHGSHHSNIMECKYQFCPNCGARMDGEE